MNIAIIIKISRAILWIKQKLLFFFILSLVFNSSTFANERSIFNGFPITTRSVLSTEAFTAFDALGVKGAELVWFNEDYFLENNIQLPVEVRDPINLNKYSTELKQWAIHQWAYMTLNKFLPSDFYSNDKKMFYADFYGGSGGDGVNGDPDSLGSGRAASAGAFNIKGIGRTPLASSDDPNVVSGRGPKRGIIKKIQHRLSAGHHLHGGASLREAMMEAIWGELLNKELPHGANRVVAIISVPATIGHLREPRALIVRENSIRPAHFMRTPGGMKKSIEQEQKRISILQGKLMEYLNIDVNSPLRGMAFRGKLFEMSLKMAQTFATEYAHSIFHGATSPSNIEISGKALDHGPLTTIDGFTRATYADFSGNGDVYSLLDELILEFVNELRLTLPGDIVSQIPSDREIRDYVTNAYKAHQQSEILWRAGIPRVIIEQNKNDPSLIAFASVLLKIVADGNEKYVSVKTKVPKKTGKYDLGQILIKVLNSEKNPIALDKAVKEVLKDDSIRKEFVETYFSAYLKVKEEAEKKGVGMSSLNKYLEFSASFRNKTRVELFRGVSLWINQYVSILKSRISRPEVVSDFVDNMINLNSNFDSREMGFKVQTNRQKISKLGIWVTEYYDAQIDDFITVYNLNKALENKLGIDFSKLSMSANEIYLVDESGKEIKLSIIKNKDSYVGYQRGKFNLSKGEIKFKNVENDKMKKMLNKCLKNY